MLLQIFKFMVSWQFTVISCIVIVFFAIIMGIYYYSKIKSIRNELRAAIKIIRNMPDAKGFINSYREFEDYCCNNKLIKPGWMDFKSYLIFPDPNAANEAIWKTNDPDIYFNESALIGKKFNLRILRAVPNYLTGLGLLGTFLGLVAGIFLAQEGLASAKDIQIQGLQNLLKGAALAFWTSVCGLMFSIIFSMSEKKWLNKLNAEINEWNSEINCRIESISPEKLAKVQLDQLEKQTDFLQEFTTKVAFNIAEALGDKMNAQLGPVLESLSKSIQTLRTDAVDKISETISGAAGKEIGVLVGNLNLMNQSMGPLLQNMQDSHKSMQEAALNIGGTIQQGVNSAVTQLQQGMEATIEAFKNSFSEAVGKVQVVVGDLEEGFVNHNNLLTITGNTIEKFQGLLTTFSSTADQIREIQVAMGNVLEMLQRTSVSIADSGTATREATGQIKGAVEAVRAVMNEVKTIQQALHQTWESYSHRFENLDRTLERVFEKLDEGLRAYAESTKNYMAAMDEHATKVTEQFGAAVTEFGESIQDLADTQGRGQGVK